MEEKENLANVIDDQSQKKFDSAECSEKSSELLASTNSTAINELILSLLGVFTIIVIDFLFFDFIAIIWRYDLSLISLTLCAQGMASTSKLFLVEKMENMSFNQDEENRNTILGVFLINISICLIFGIYLLENKKLNCDLFSKLIFVSQIYVFFYCCYYFLKVKSTKIISIRSLKFFILIPFTLILLIKA